MNEVEQIMEYFGMPELPEAYDGEDSAQLVLFRENDSNIVLAESVSIPDALEYCSREDTHGGGWFAGYNLN